MELLICIAAATVAWVTRSLWYFALKTPHERAIGAPVRNTGDPQDASPLPYFVAGACLLVMAVFLRALFLHYQIATLIEGLGIGIGIGVLIAMPLVIMNNVPPQRSATLALIDGGNAILVCATLGTILGAL